MLGVTGILVGAVFLTSIFLQTALGFSALETGLAFLPFALAITAGTVVARHLLGHLSPRAIAGTGLAVCAAAAALLSTAPAAAHFATDVLPGLIALGLGIGMVFVPVSVTSMAGIPASHAGVASGFLMTGHEIGAALGVAVLSAVASTAGALTDAEGAADAFSRGFVGAAVLAADRRGLRPRADVLDGDLPGAGADTCTCTREEALLSGSRTGSPDPGGRVPRGFPRAGLGLPYAAAIAPQALRTAP